MYLSLIKPVLDRAFALMGLIVLSPLFILVSVLLLIFQKGAIFFVQTRVGKREKTFRLVKFCTMKPLTEGTMSTPEGRVTGIGKFLRRTSLDELPQLINILIGDMSFIGPRPLLLEYLPLYNNEQRKRHLVKPGITGLAQVNGRTGIPWKLKFQYDIEYVDHVSLAMDVGIFIKTVGLVFSFLPDVSLKEEPFKGN